MISRVTGKLVEITDHHALVENGGLFYEVLLPSALAQRLRNNGGLQQMVTLETIYYIEAGDRKSSHYPRLVGFTDRVDKEFFSLLTQVSGMGVKKSLKSLVIPIREIAAAIENKDAATLNRLPGVGGRLAEKIIAELHGKTTKFALAKSEEPLSAPRSAAGPLADEAREVLLQLQYSRPESDRMISRAMKSNPSISKVEHLIAEIFREQQKDRKTAD